MNWWLLRWVLLHVYNMYMYCIVVVVNIMYMLISNTVKPLNNWDRLISSKLYCCKEVFLFSEVKLYW